MDSSIYSPLLPLFECINNQSVQSQLLSTTETEDNTGLRSKKMSLLRLYCPIDLANQFIFEIGTLQLVHFVDIETKRSVMDRKFSKQIIQSQDMLRIISKVIAIEF